MSEIKGLHSPDLLDLGAENPPDVENCCILVEVSVGPKGARGEEYFEVVVVTPTWLAEHISERGYLFARHYLIVKRYDFDVVKSAIFKQFQGVQGSSWSDVAERLARHGRWEFEDYRAVSDGAQVNGV